MKPQQKRSQLQPVYSSGVQLECKSVQFILLKSYFLATIVKKKKKKKGLFNGSSACSSLGATKNVSVFVYQRVPSEPHEEAENLLKTSVQFTYIATAVIRDYTKGMYLRTEINGVNYLACVYSFFLFAQDVHQCRDMTLDEHLALRGHRERERTSV